MDTSRSQTVQELGDIPLVRSVLGIYTRTKEANAVLTFGFSAAEKGFGFVVDTVLDTTGCSQTADYFIGSFVSNFKESYPLLQKPPEKIYRKIKQRTKRYFERRVRSALRSSVGQVFIAGVDSITERTNKTCRRLRHDTRARKMSKSERHVQTEVMSPTKTSRGQQTKLTGADDKWVKKLTRDDEQQKQPAYSLSYFLLLPLEFLLNLLRLFQKKVHALAGMSTERRKSVRLQTEEASLSPEKVEEIEARRKVSPRKRINSSLFRGIKSAAFRMLGFDATNIKQTDIRQFLSCSKHKSLNTSPVVSADDTEKKRKHDDILSDSEASSDDEDLVNMDLKNYVSDEDPDYEPTDDSESDVSIETDEEEEESDFETVESDGLVRIKEKENVKPKEIKTKEVEGKPDEVPKIEKKVDEGPKIESVNKQKENKTRSPTKKTVLSPKKPTNTTIMSIVTNRSPVKQFGGKDEKKDVNQKPIDTSKPPDSGNKTQPQNLGGNEKSGNQEKQGPKKC